MSLRRSLNGGKEMETDLVEFLGVQQRLGRPLVARLGEFTADFFQNLLAFGGRLRGGHGAQIAVANPLDQDSSFGHTVP